jgi:hypothetical protein
MQNLAPGGKRLNRRFDATRFFKGAQTAAGNAKPRTGFQFARDATRAGRQKSTLFNAGTASPAR